MKSTLAKVESDEVDAGVVYVTDVRAAGSKVKGIVIPGRRQRVDRVPDRRADQGAEFRGSQGFRGLRPVVRGPERALGGRFRAALSLTGRSPAAGRHGRRPATRGARADRRPRAGRFRVPARAADRAAGPGAVARHGPAAVRQPGAHGAAAFAGMRDVATAVSLVLGVPLAWVLARSRSRVSSCYAHWSHSAGAAAGRGRAGAAAGARSPRHRRPIPRHWFGYPLPFTTAGVIVAETFVAMPFLIVTVEGALRSSDRELEEAASTLRASRLTIFRRITLPLIGPSLLAGAALCWARALGEFGATITFAGNFPGTTQTMPLAVYQRAGDRPGGGDRAQPGAARRSCRHPGGAARSAAQAAPGLWAPAHEGCASLGGVDAGDVPARRRVAVAPGEVLGVLGPNGAGKTTLLTRAGRADPPQRRPHRAGPGDPGRRRHAVPSCPPSSGRSGWSSRTTGSSRICPSGKTSPSPPVRGATGRTVAAAAADSWLARLGPDGVRRAASPGNCPVVRRSGWRSPEPSRPNRPATARRTVGRARRPQPPGGPGRAAPPPHRLRRARRCSSRTTRSRRW